MTKRQYRNYSYLSFFFCIAYSGFLINAAFRLSGLSRLISVVLFGFLIIMQLRIAFTMRRNFRNLDLK